MTLLCYLDESNDSTFSFHAGVLADGRVVHAVERDVDLVIEGAFEAGACSYRSELHGQDLFHGTGGWAKGDPAQRVQVYREALQLLSAHGVEVMARGTSLVSFARKYGNLDPYEWQFSGLLERINERLKRLDAYGLVIADQQHQYREQLQRAFADAREYGTGGYRSSTLERIVDTAHFVDSKRSRMVQLADLAVFVIRRRRSFPREGHPLNEQAMADLFDLVMDAIPDPPGRYLSVRF